MRLLRSLDGWCPVCPTQRSTWDGGTPYIRTCSSCGLIYFYPKDLSMPICEQCMRAQATCGCHSNRPKAGQWIKITRKFKSGLIETWEGPIHEVIWDDDPRIVRSVRIGDADYRRTFNLGTQETGMIEPGSWEIILPAEPPNKSVWVCPASNDQGKFAVWRRLDHLPSAGSVACWFYPGSTSGVTWEQVYNHGPGYLLEPKND